MKYSIVIVQIIIISVLVYQFEHIEENSTKINVTSNIEYIYYDEGKKIGDLYVDYNINKVRSEVVTFKKELDYNEPVYVTLTVNDENIHEVRQVTLKKPKEIKDDDVILRANYQYKDSKGMHYLQYGFEWIKNIDQFGTFEKGDRILVTIYVGKWGQQKIVQVEKN